MNSKSNLSISKLTTKLYRDDDDCGNVTTHLIFLVERRTKVYMTFEIETFDGRAVEFSSKVR